MPELSHVEMPIWMVVLIVSLMISLVGVIWKRMDTRVGKLEETEAYILKSRTDRGGFLTVDKHEEICGNNKNELLNHIFVKIDSLEKLMNVKFENLSMLIEKYGNGVKK